MRLLLAAAFLVNGTARADAYPAPCLRQLAYQEREISAAAWALLQSNTPGTGQEREIDFLRNHPDKATVRRTLQAAVYEISRTPVAGNWERIGVYTHHVDPAIFDTYREELAPLIGRRLVANALLRLNRSLRLGDPDAALERADVMRALDSLPRSQAGSAAGMRLRQGLTSLGSMDDRSFTSSQISGPPATNCKGFDAACELLSAHLLSAHPPLFQRLVLDAKDEIYGYYLEAIIAWLKSEGCSLSAKTKTQLTRRLRRHISDCINAEESGVELLYNNLDLEALLNAFINTPERSIQDIADELFGKKAPKRLTARAFVGEPRIGIENIPQLRRAANLLRAEPDGATEEMPYIELTLNVKSLQGKPAVIGHLYYRPAGTNVTCRAARVEEIARLGRVPYALTAAGELLDLSTSRVVDIFTTYYRSHHDSFPELLTLAGLAETSSTRLATDEVRQPLLARIEASRIPVIGKNWSEIVTISETIPHRERIAIASLLKNTLGGSVDAFVYRGRNAVQIGEAKVLGWSNGFWSTLPKILRTGEGLLITLKRSTSNPDRLEIFFFSRPRHQPGTMSTDTNNVVELSRLPLWIKLTTDGQMEDIGAQGTISVDRLFEAQWGVTIVPIGISGNFHIGGNKTRASSYSGLAKIAAAIDPDVTLTYLQEHAIMILHTASSAVSHPHAQLVIPGYLNERIALSSDLYPLFPAHYRHTSGKHSFLLSTILRAQHQAWQAGDANGIRSRFTETHPDLKPAMERRFKNTRLRRAKFRNAEKTAPAATAPVDKKSKEPATPVRVARERPKRQARTLESPAPAHRATPEVVDQTPSAAHPTPDATPAVQAVADTPAPAAPAPGATGGISAQTAASPRTVLVPVSSPMLLSPVDHRSADAAVQLSIVIGATAKPADQLLARALGFLTDGSVLLSHGEHERARILFVRAHNCARSKLAGDTRTIAGDILNIATNALAACDDQIGYACLRIHDGATAEAVIAGLLERRAAAARDLQQLKKNDQVQTLAFFDRYLENIFERLRMYAHDDWFEEARATAQQRIARLTEEITGQGVYRNRFQSSSAHETDLRTRALETRVREESV